MKKVKTDDLEKILDFLQRTYKVRLDPDRIPLMLRNPFYNAVRRFSDPRELQKIETTKMGICEEVADLAYQVLKLICLTYSILGEKTISTLNSYLKKENYYDNEGLLVGIDYAELDALSKRLVPNTLVEKLVDILPPVIFSPKKDNGFSIIKDFLAGQFVAHISRIWTGRHRNDAEALIHLRDEKLPEETKELIEALIKSSENLTGGEAMKDLESNLYLSRSLFTAVSNVRKTLHLVDICGIFSELVCILRSKIEKPITVEDTLHLMFLKMKGRQEMTFSGIDENTMRLTCKPVEYLIEADMFF